jgi:uncharacterized protein YPO0396
MSTQTLPGFDEPADPQPGPAPELRPLVDAVHPGQWRLEGVELVNWGTFQGHHVVDVARRGFLLTGHSGSGKSSLVDAITAVLTPPHRIRFNAAAADQGGHRSDRTFAAYVRGAWRRQTDESTGEVVSQYLRPGATWSGIALRFADGRGGAPVVLVKLFHLRAGENTKPTELHVLAGGGVSLLDLQPYARDGLDVRRLKAAHPDAYVTDKHSSFAARFCRTFGIGGDNALALLHKTQSAKNLGSLDDLFRGFMLDEPSTFALADIAVEQFAELSAAHRSVITARDQVAHLTPLRRIAQDLDESVAAVTRTAALREALPAFTDRWQLELARTERDRLVAEVAVAQQAVDEARLRAAEADSAVRAAELVVSRHGGQALAERQAHADAAAQAVDRVQRELTILTGRLASVGVRAPESFEEFEELRREAVAERRSAEEEAEGERARLHAAFAAPAEARARVAAIDRELGALKRVRSNLPADLLGARTLVCRATGLPPDVLPFAGELLQVREEHRDWTGSLERVLRPLATMLLVPAVHRDVVVRAVDQHHLRARLVLEIVPAHAERPPLVGSPGSLVHRVEVKTGPMKPWLDGVLARQYDYECVADDSALHGLDRAVTRRGQVKRGVTRLEKDDRFEVDDRARWILGFGNEEKVEHLLALRRTADAELRRLEAEAERVDDARSARQGRIAALAALSDRSWAEIDVRTARETHARAEAAVAELRAASTDLRAAEAALTRAQEGAAPAHVAVEVARSAHAAADSSRETVARVVSELARREIPDVSPDRHAELEHRFYAVQRAVRYDGIDKIARTLATTLGQEHDRHVAACTQARQSTVELTTEFRRRWEALAGDLTTSVDDRAGYLAILGRLESDRLPEFEERFHELMQSQSQRNVGVLASQIRRAPGEIRDKIVPINASLRRSEFDRGRFLQIRVDENRSTTATEFLADLRAISSGSWADESRDAAEQRYAVMERVMRRLGSSDTGDRTWRGLCLDTRRHVRFTGVEVDRDGLEVNIHDSSAGLSGGQRQKLVVFCLAAALRYQLTADDQELPTFGTVVLDEAFDKADAAFTRMAMDVFVEFGFHMVLATPLKLLQTLEEYVGGIGLATCRDFRESRVGLVLFEEVAVDDDSLRVPGGPAGAS